jgi:tetratricopeptide (TPR) repeat protein
VESFAERAQRLSESGQIDAAVDVLDEGLRKHPDNSWLLMRKAILLTNEGKIDLARPLVQKVIDRQPKHMGAQSLLVRLVLETEGILAGVAQFQRALEATPPEHRRGLGRLARLIGVLLVEAHLYAEALKHLSLAQAIEGPGHSEAVADSTVELVMQNTGVPAWLKHTEHLSPAPPNVLPAQRARFEEALRRADQGLWASAASAFEALAAEGAGPVASRNLGFCRLWLADSKRAVPALRRYIATLGKTEEAVDLEALCQVYDENDRDEVVERVQLIWPVRNREGLLAVLERSPEIQAAGVGPLDAEDPESPQVQQFVLLDRPQPDQTSGLRIGDVPRVLATIMVGQEIVALEAFDDKRLQGLSDRFAALAGSNIPPAHPRTKVLGTYLASSVALLEELALPQGTEQAETDRLERESRQHIVREVWPHTKFSYLNGRTPLEAAQAGNAIVALRAAILRLELSGNGVISPAIIAELRQRLSVPLEPEIDADTVQIDRVHPARLHLVPAERLSDDKLIALHQRARQTAQPLALRRATQAVIERPALFERGVPLLATFVDQANIAATDGNREAAFEWLRRGRQADPASQQVAQAASWDMHEVRLRARLDRLEDWVPELSIVLDRYHTDPAANQAIVSHLVALGLIQMARHPDNPDEILLDSRPLQLLLTQFGPKVTTASGRLGVSAARGGIWTPGSEAGGAGGGLWTPGSNAGPPAAASDKPRLIIPGR